MKRILQIVTTMDLGGAETLLMNLYRNIDREKLQFDFLCHNRIESKYADEICELGGKMYMVKGVSHVGLFKYQKNLYDFFKEHPEYQTVHSHVGELNGVILYQAKKAGVLNLYSHSHCTYLNCSRITKLRLNIFKLFFKNNVTHAFACGDEAGKALYTGALKRNFEVIPNGVDTKRFVYSYDKRKSFREEFDLGDKTVIGHIGRFSRAKNHKFIIEIFNEILKNNNDIHLLLVGIGDLMPDIEKQVKDLKIEKNVHFLGSRRDIPEFLSAIDLLLFPSLYEGLSVAMVEAQASGLPILTSDSVSSESAITNKVKQISLDLSANEWAKIALEMLENPICDERSTYADKVKDAGYDIKVTAKKLQDFYLKY